MKHTPGPWILDVKKANVYALEPKSNDGISVRFWADITRGSFDTPEAEVDANARLIAAAPDLLEALKYAELRLNDFDVQNYAITSAIAKAKGETG